jgi:hypothetical protein
MAVYSRIFGREETDDEVLSYKGKNNSFSFGDLTNTQKEQQNITDVDKFRVLCSPILAVFNLARFGDTLSTTFNMSGFQLFNGMAIVVFRSFGSLFEAKPNREDTSLTTTGEVSKKQKYKNHI